MLPFVFRMLDIADSYLLSSLDVCSLGVRTVSLRPMLSLKIDLSPRELSPKTDLLDLCLPFESRSFGLSR